IAIGQQKNACEGPAVIALAERVQRGAERRRSAGESQLAEVLKGLQPGIEGVATHVEIFFKFALPGCALRIQQLSKRLASAALLAAVLDLQALAVIGDNGKKVCAWPRVLARPKRFQQANRQRGNSESLQDETRPADESNGSAVTPGQQDQSDRGCAQGQP